MRIRLIFVRHFDATWLLTGFSLLSILFSTIALAEKEGNSSADLEKKEARWEGCRVTQALADGVNASDESRRLGQSGNPANDKKNPTGRRSKPPREPIPFVFTPDLKAKDDPRKILGVSADADAATIEKAYREASRRYHPDHFPGNSEAEVKARAQAEKDFILVGKAHDSLINGGAKPQRRSGGFADIDAGLASFYEAMDRAAHGGQSRATVDPFAQTSPDFKWAFWRWTESKGLGNEGYEPRPPMRFVLERLARAAASSPDFAEAYLAAIEAANEPWGGGGAEHADVAGLYLEVLRGLYPEFRAQDPDAEQMARFHAAAGTVFDDAEKGIINPNPGAIAALKEGEGTDLYGKILEIGTGYFLLETPEGHQYKIKNGYKDKTIEISQDLSVQSRKLGLHEVAEVGDHVQVKLSANGDGTLDYYHQANLIRPSPERLKRYQEERQRADTILSEMQKAKESKDWKKIRDLNAALWRNQLTIQEREKAGQVISFAPHEEQPLRVVDNNDRVFAVDAVNKIFGIELDGMSRAEFLTFLDAWANRKVARVEEDGDETYLYRTIEFLGLPDSIAEQTLEKAILARLQYFEDESKAGRKYNHERDFRERYNLEQSFETKFGFSQKHVSPTVGRVKFLLQTAKRIADNDLAGWNYGRMFLSEALNAVEDLVYLVENSDFPDRGSVRAALQNAVPELRAMHAKLMNAPEALEKRYADEHGPSRMQYFQKAWGDNLGKIDDIVAQIEAWGKAPQIAPDHRPLGLPGAR